MNIVVPIRSVEEVAPVIAAGADELYCGVLTLADVKKHSSRVAFNKRNYLAANLNSYQELHSVIKIAHSYNIAVSFTINAVYPESLLPSVMEQIGKAIDCGADSLIVADIGLLNLLKNMPLGKTKIYSSCCAYVFNAESAMFYRSLGVSKVIFPRHLTVQEVKQIIKKIPELEFETLILNDKCPFVDGLCAFEHNPSLSRGKLSSLLAKKLPFFVSSPFFNSINGYLFKKNIENKLSCCMQYDVKSIAQGHCRKAKAEGWSYFFNSRKFLHSCGACALYELRQAGVQSIKIAGRYQIKPEKVKNTAFIKEAVMLLDKDLGKEGYAHQVKLLYRKIFGYACRQDLCYYKSEL